MYLNTRNHRVHLMSEHKEKEKKLATNRLLDILRSQETRKDDSEKNIKIDPDTVIDEEAAPEAKKDDEESSFESKEKKAGEEQTLVKEKAPIHTDVESILQKDKPGPVSEGILTESKETRILKSEEPMPASEDETTEKKIDNDLPLADAPVPDKKVSVEEDPTKKEDDQLAKMAKSDQVTEEVSPVKPPAVKEFSSQDLLSTLSKIQSDDSLPDEKKVIQRAGVTPPVEMAKLEVEKRSPKISSPQKKDGTGSSTLLEQIQKPKTKPKSQEMRVIQPREFDSSLFSTISVKKAERTPTDYLQSIFHLFNESSRRVAIHHGKNSIRLLQMNIGFSNIEIERTKEYVLPFTTEDKIIKNSNDLLRFILREELDSKELKYAYGSYYSPEIETKTHILQVPSLNKKELTDLVDWNAKKNIPFSPDQAIIDFEVSKKAVSDDGKHNLVIGISEEGEIQQVIDYFKESKLKPRLISTLPVLLWKLFIRHYPDRKSGCYILVHLGENKTTLSLVKNQQLLLTREILFGAEDFYEAAMQKVVTKDRSFKIEYSEAKKLLLDYGIPNETNGMTVDNHVSLYKLSIFIRPAIERLTGELNRSMKYFKKQIPDIEWSEMLFSGICATFPNLVTSVGNDLNVKAGLLNPMRNGAFKVKDDGVVKNSLLPLFTTNFALVSEEVERINVIPKKLRVNYRYLLLYKVAAVLVAFFLPIYLIATIMSGFNIDNLNEKISSRKNQWDKLSVQAKEYIGLMTDIDILNGYRFFLDNDRIHSKNIISLMKMFSSTVPKDIKLTKIHIKKMSTESNNTSGSVKFKDGLTLSGFVQADASVSDIHLTNFVMKLEQLNMFSKIELNMDETSKNTEGKLFFSMNLRY